MKYKLIVIECIVFLIIAFAISYVVKLGNDTNGTVSNKTTNYGRR